MNQIILIKTFYIFRNTGIITDKWIVFLRRNKINEKLFEQRIIQCKKEAERVFEGFKESFPDAKIVYVDKTKCEITKHKYNVLSEELKKKLAV